MKFTTPFAILLFVFLVSCKNNTETLSEIKALSADIKTAYAPDKRVALFEIDIQEIDNQLILEGKTTSEIALLTLLDSLNSKKIKFKNKVRVLPDTLIGHKIYAVAKNAVINIRSQPKHAAELGTQGLLGMSLKVLDKQGDFYQIQTPDNYISWVDKGGIIRMKKEEFDTWNASKKIIFTEISGVVYADKNKNGPIVSDITLGGLLKYVAEDATFYQVAYPDNRSGFILKNQATIYKNWLQKLTQTTENIETIATKFNGFPYLWGGTSSKGIDCSGFTKMVYLMNGFIIPRDASQQINAGTTVDVNLSFKDLEKGDLLFFGTRATATKKQRVVHVGIWLGNDKMEFIHASGNVHISSMDAKQSNYDAFNKDRYLGSKRYLGASDKNIINLKDFLKL
ncbi:C40 family peptidase [uncultured Polaribacter sp.]|uniref:C40 family peptidase n=1 Tax=uncultured Polaribacter sp. TaxID=174711 RepID=UPI002614E137|nr:C40 family peptidase [uncultured Polaribacter sp.]